MKLILAADMIRRIEQLYQDMACAYDRVAAEIGLSCDGCPDNCCDSYFLHHTYLEWAYLWHGLEQLEPSVRQRFIQRAREYDRQSQAVLVEGGRPRLMCPLNEEGRCRLYRYRLMVCRTHGVPASMTRPDGRTSSFPGCFVCQELVGTGGDDPSRQPLMERTELLRRLALLEYELLGGRRHLLPRVKKTIARMLLDGPPELPRCSDGCAPNPDPREW